MIVRKVQGGVALCPGRMLKYERDKFRDRIPGWKRGRAAGQESGEE